MDVSESSETLRPVVVVNAVVIDTRGYVLITRRRDNSMWCLPGGYVEFGETVREAVYREVLEETSVGVDVTHCTGIYSEPNLSIIAPAKVPVIVIAFKCFPKKGEPLPSDEVSEAQYVDVTNLPPMISTHPPRIIDAIRTEFSVKVT